MGVRSLNAVGPKAATGSVRNSYCSGVTTSHSFPKCVSLRRPAQFSRVFEKPKRTSDGLFTVLARRNELGFPRLGLAISKKSVGKTNVKRNRFRRVVRESFRLSQHELPNVDVVVMAKQGVQKASSQELQQSLNNHWRSIVRLCGPLSSH
ncbi:MAG: ribonuclease P protein component [Pseudomonadota bacterium]